MKIKIIIMLFLNFAVTVFADVPMVQKIDVTKDGEITILNFQIRHGSPSTNHYIDIIEVEINERLEPTRTRINDLEPQTSTVFSYEYNIGTVQYESIKVRVHCNIHGWSSWTSLEVPIPSPTILPSPTGPTPSPTPTPTGPTPTPIPASQPDQDIPPEWIAAIIVFVIVVAVAVTIWIRKITLKS